VQTSASSAEGRRTHLDCSPIGNSGVIDIERSSATALSAHFKAFGDVETHRKLGYVMRSTF